MELVNEISDTEHINAEEFFSSVRDNKATLRGLVAKKQKLARLTRDANGEVEEYQRTGIGRPKPKKAKQYVEGVTNMDKLFHTVTFVDDDAQGLEKHQWKKCVENNTLFPNTTIRNAECSVACIKKYLSTQKYGPNPKLSCSFNVDHLILNFAVDKHRRSEDFKIDFYHGERVTIRCDRICTISVKDRIQVFSIGPVTETVNVEYTPACFDLKLMLHPVVGRKYFPLRNINVGGQLPGVVIMDTMYKNLQSINAPSKVLVVCGSLYCPNLIIDCKKLVLFFQDITVKKNITALQINAPIQFVIGNSFDSQSCTGSCKISTPYPIVTIDCPPDFVEYSPNVEDDEETKSEIVEYLPDIDDKDNEENKNGSAYKVENFNLSHNNLSCLTMDTMYRCMGYPFLCKGHYRNGLWCILSYDDTIRIANMLMADEAKETVVDKGGKKMLQKKKLSFPLLPENYDFLAGIKLFASLLRSVIDWDPENVHSFMKTYNKMYSSLGLLVEKGKMLKTNLKAYTPVYDLFNGKECEDARKRIFDLMYDQMESFNESCIVDDEYIFQCIERLLKSLPYEEIRSKRVFINFIGGSYKY